MDWGSFVISFLVPYILTLFLPLQLRWDCGRIVDCVGIETIVIQATVDCVERTITESNGLFGHCTIVLLLYQCPVIVVPLSGMVWCSQ